MLAEGIKGVGLFLEKQETKTIIQRLVAYVQFVRIFPIFRSLATSNKPRRPCHSDTMLVTAISRFVFFIKKRAKT